MEKTWGGGWQQTGVLNLEGDRNDQAAAACRAEDTFVLLPASAQYRSLKDTAFLTTTEKKLTSCKKKMGIS